MDAAIRAPSGGNQQNWHFLLVDDPGVKGVLGPHYRRAMGQLWETVYAPTLERARARPDSPASKSVLAVQRSAQWLADHFEQIPLFLFAFSLADPTGGSIYPAVWSAMLAARGEGIGSSLTTILSYFAKDETLEVLRVPVDEGWILAACVSFGYPTGRWAVAERRPVHEVTDRNHWGESPGFEVPEPLWSPG